MTRFFTDRKNRPVFKKGLNAAINWYVMQNYPRIKQYQDHPHRAQAEVFDNLIATAKHTEWGKKYGYDSIKNYATFADRVPIGDYDSHKADIKRMMDGETDVLWEGRVTWFSKSSGTTGDKSKFLPVSAENLKRCHLQGTRDLMSLFHLHYPEATLFEGKGVVMGGSLYDYANNPRTKFGDVSAIMIEHIPPFFKHLFNTPGLDVSLMSEWEAKIERIANITVHENVTNIGGVPTWTLVLFRRILELTGKQHILEVWPQFQVYFHGGVSFQPYRQQFRDLLPSDQVKYFEVYNASEGYFAAQSDPDDPSLLLFLDNGVFYEFLPMEEWDKPTPKAIPLEAVELGKRYAIVISTNAGLWRYQIGDTITFTSISPYKIRIVGRTKHFINVFGEEVMVGNTDQALATTCQQTGAIVTEYTVAPIYLTEKGGHEWVIEFSQAPPSLDTFSQLLDQNLQAINSDYEAKRYKSMLLEQLRLHAVPQGTFHGWMRAKGKYGGQHKVPRLANHRQYVTEIFEHLKTKS